MTVLFRHLARLQLLRYLLASAVSLALDMACFLALLALGVGPMPASAAGYALGIAAHWCCSSRVVFAGQVAAPGSERNRQKALFVGSALIGLAVTALVVGTATALGLGPQPAKLAAIAASFTITWLLRRQFVFT